VRRFAIITLWLTLASGAGAQTSPVASPFKLDLTITGDHLVQGQQIPATIRIRNTSGKKLHVLFQEKDIYGRPLLYPAELRVRVADDAGEVLTVSDRAPDGWWSSLEPINPHLLVRDTRQRVEIKPGHEITREVRLGDVLAGSPSLGAGIPPGRYTVRASINGVESNEASFEVVAP
jgi:hypothetical protein